MFNKIGFLGQGFIGKNLADNFEERGFKNLVRYSKEAEYIKNKDKIKEWGIVFVAVPTPTTVNGFDYSIIEEVIALTKPLSIVVIKSTILPDTTRKLVKVYPDRHIMHCIEFLSEDTVREDTDKPDRNIIGISDVFSADDRKRAEEVMAILPEAPFEMICNYEEAALIKYIGNCFFYTKNVFFNMMYDLTVAYGADWATVREGVIADPRIHPVHTDVFHKGGRGAGGHCLLKDFAAMTAMYNKMVKDPIGGENILLANESKNVDILKKSGKDSDLLKGVYGENI